MTPSSEFINRHWPLDRVIVGPILQRYPTRATVAIDTAQGRFVAKSYANEAALGLVEPSTEEIERSLDVFGYLERNGFGHAPRLLPTREGRSFARTRSRTVYLLERIEGSAAPDTAAPWAGLGRIAARLNSYTGYPHTYPIGVRGKIAEMTREARDYPFSAELLGLVASPDVLADQPPSLIHAEINTGNTLITPDGRLYLLDWDSAGAGPTVLEAGYPLITVFLTEDLIFRRDMADAFYNAYTAGEGMTSEGKELLFTAALLHALRYLKFGDINRRWTRICYALSHRDLLLSVIASREETGA